MYAPPEEAVPPRMYGGTERIVSEVTERLVTRGFHVILYASGDSQTSAELVPTVPQSIRTMPEAQDQSRREALHRQALMVALEDIRSRQDEIDIVHNNSSPEPQAEHLWRGMVPGSTLPWVHTLHGRLDYPRFVETAPLCPGANYISISESQRRLYPNLDRYLATIPNGTRIPDLPINPSPKGGLSFVGRMSPEKGPLNALEIARITGMTVTYAAKVDQADQEWFDAVVKPALARAGSFANFIGEVTPEERDLLLADSKALVAPIEWHEPFGLFVIEAMAAGTPVVASARGALPELIVDGETGFLCNPLKDGRADTTEMARKVLRVGNLSRLSCRKHVEANFNVDLMVDRYTQAYETVLNSRVN